MTSECQDTSDGLDDPGPSGGMPRGWPCRSRSRITGVENQGRESGPECMRTARRASCAQLQMPCTANDADDRLPSVSRAAPMRRRRLSRAD
jgi:hypothetical protein